MLMCLLIPSRLFWESIWRKTVAVALMCMWHCKSLSPTGYLRAQHLKTGLTLGRPDMGRQVWESVQHYYSTELPDYCKETLRPIYLNLFFFFFWPQESCLVSMAWTSRNCEVVPWLLGQRSCKMVSASGSAWLALTYLSGWIKLNCLNLDLCQS